MVLCAAILVLALIALASIMVGARSIAPSTVIGAIFQFNGSDEHIMVRELRVPRTVVGLVVGPALGLCGALIQGFTRNPLADPGILGVNAGASFAVTCAVAFAGLTAPSQFVWFALLGAFLFTVLVYAIGSIGDGKASPVKLTLAGVAIAAVLNGFTSAVVIKNEATFDVMRFWAVGSIGGRPLDTLAVCLPLIALGLILTLICARPLNALSLGDELAVSMGVKIRTTRAMLVLAITLLAGCAVTLAGPIGFLGLMVPHIVRWIVGPDQRWILLITALVAPAFLLLADIVGRIVMNNGELRVGIVTALIGGPVLIALVRRKEVSAL
jgi:iron complex transport system permease protein